MHCWLCMRTSGGGTHAFVSTALWLTTLLVSSSSPPAAQPPDFTLYCWLGMRTGGGASRHCCAVCTCTGSNMLEGPQMSWCRGEGAHLLVHASGTGVELDWGRAKGHLVAASTAQPVPVAPPPMMRTSRGFSGVASAKWLKCSLLDGTCTRLYMILAKNTTMTWCVAPFTLVQHNWYTIGKVRPHLAGAGLQCPAASRPSL